MQLTDAGKNKSTAELLRSIRMFEEQIANCSSPDHPRAVQFREGIKLIREEINRRSHELADILDPQ